MRSSGQQPHAAVDGTAAVATSTAAASTATASLPVARGATVAGAGADAGPGTERRESTHRDELAPTALADQLREVRDELTTVWELRDVLRRALDRIGNLEEELDSLRGQVAAGDGEAGEAISS